MLVDVTCCTRWPGGSPAVTNPRAFHAVAAGEVRVRAMRDRLCSKVGCSREAVTTMTYDYRDQMAVVGPLGIGPDPHAHDLCHSHTERMSVPAGWMVVRHETLRVG